LSIVLITAANTIRTQTTTLATTIYVVDAQMESNATFATSHIPTINTPVTRAAYSASIHGNNFSSWYNPLEGTSFGVEFRTLYSMNNTQRFILTGNGGAPLQPLSMAPKNYSIESSDGQSTLLGKDSVVGVLLKAFLVYSATGRSLSARGSSAANSGTANNFTSTNAIHIGYLSSE
jgi:hypothetical protein